MQYLRRHRPRESEMIQDYSNHRVLALIEDRIHNERDRSILRDRLIHGLTYEQLAESYFLSVRQVKRIVYRGQDSIFK